MLYQRRDCHQGLHCGLLFQQGDYCCGRLGYWQGRLHIHFEMRSSCYSSVRFDLIKEDVAQSRRLRVT
jgi:hypothetical protein